MDGTGPDFDEVPPETRLIGIIGIELAQELAMLDLGRLLWDDERLLVCNGVGRLAAQMWVARIGWQLIMIRAQRVALVWERLDRSWAVSMGVRGMGSAALSGGGGTAGTGHRRGVYRLRWSWLNDW